MKLAALLLALPLMSNAQNYKAEQTSDHGIAVVHLTDAANAVEVSIVPSVGNEAYEMKVHGKNILHFPYADVSEFQKRPALSGIPFLAPWGNRLDQQAFIANGKKYPFDMTLGNVRGANPIHGLLSSSPYWHVTEAAADQRSAHVTSRLEFWKYPELMKQWPFAHEYEMTYSLADGVLEVRITITNLSAEPMPIAVAFHPYYRIPDVPRDQWIGHVPAKLHVEADKALIPTGEFKPSDLPDPFPLKGRTLDDGFTDLLREADGRAHFSIESGGKKVEAMFGPKYPVAVVWEPTGQEFICFEPMSGITNAVNMNKAQTVQPGAKWTESFWIKTTGL